MDNATRDNLSGALLTYFTRGNPAHAHAVQAAHALFGTHGLAEIDRLVRHHSASNGLVDLLCGTHPHYRPTVQVEPRNGRAQERLDCAERARIADAYDALARTIGDSRRAYRC